jgi:hypothetical protein
MHILRETKFPGAVLDWSIVFNDTFISGWRQRGALSGDSPSNCVRNVCFCGRNAKEVVYRVALYWGLILSYT